MTKKLIGHEMVRFDKDVVIIGGWSIDSSPGRQSSLYRLTCQNQDCEWKTM